MKTKPNIIFFFSDQQRFDTIGAYGQRLDITPNLDTMAKEGVLFQNAFTCQPVCGPARACLQTGKYATETGCYRNAIHLPLDEKTIAHHFSDHGYEVAYIGKWHLATTAKKIDHAKIAIPPAYRGGWKDYWLASDLLELTSHGYGGYMFDASGNKREWDENTYRVDAQTDFALEYLENKNSDDPFFLFISYLEPHHQNDRKRYEGPRGSKEKYADYDVPKDLVGGSGDWEENYPDYLGACNSLDRNLGRIRKKLEENGLSNDTIIIYTSDHGSHFKTRNGEYKRSCHDASIHIPLIAYGPGFTGGKVIDDLVSLIDLPITFLQAADIPVPDAMRGKPLQETLSQSGTKRDEVFIQISEDHIGRALRTQRWTYEISAPDEISGWDFMSHAEYTEKYLYDNELDPSQKNNLVADPQYQGVRNDLRKRILKYINEVEGESPTIKTSSKS